ncbi:MAG: Ca-activated chloride channel [Myxococcales bacterium]|nr:Ca-activated chloride channel [Myxococcales bacterium]
MVEIEASGEPMEGRRPPAATVLAIDVSGSMQGAPIDQVIRSVDRLLDGLRSEDRVGVVAFSSGATRVVEPVIVDAAGKKLVRSRVARLFAEGETNVEAGLDLAVEVLGATGEGRRRGVVLLSDGEPNKGARTAEALRAVVSKHRPGTSFSALGYGVKHDEDILAAIGDAGGGGYEFVPDPATCARAFARALGAQADVVADGIELAIAPGAGIEVVRMLGGDAMRFGRDGLTIALPDMVPGTRRLVVAEIAMGAPGAQRFVLEVAKLQLAWRRPGAAASDVSTLTREVSVDIMAREPAVVGEAASRVMLVRADRVREEARALADRGNFGGAATLLRGLLAEIERVPGFAVGEGTALGEAYELLVDEAMAMERKPDQEAYAMFRKSAMGSKLALHAPPAASSRGVASSKLMEHAAGKFPEAYVVVKNGADAGKRHRLREECVIGRTASADVPIISEGVSRRHAEIYALEGEFWACDLGSTNVTKVNGAPLGSAPRKLKPGDVVLVGDVELLYEEKK